MHLCQMNSLRDLFKLEDKKLYEKQLSFFLIKCQQILFGYFPNYFFNKKLVQRLRKIIEMSEKSSLKSEIISASVERQNNLIHTLFETKIKKLQAKNIQYENGSIYVGQFYEDEQQIMKHGLGKIQTNQGDNFIGDWKFDLRQGNGIQIDKNQNRYQGSYVKNRRNGFGIQKLITGDKYIGQWRNDLKHGKGNQFYSQHSQTYKGQFKNGMRHGKGSYLYRTGDLFEGEWVEDKKQGEGMIIYYNGDIFKGNWREDIIFGKGTLAYKNGDHFIGFYKGGLRSGRGIYFYSSGNKIQAEWFGDQNCNGTIFYNNGDIYKGSIYKGNRHGFGKYFYRNGDLYEGHWSNNEKSGFGQIEKVDASYFAGNWAHNQPVYGRNSDISESPVQSQKNNISLLIQFQTPQKSQHDSKTDKYQ